MPKAHSSQNPIVTSGVDPYPSPRPPLSEGAKGTTPPVPSKLCPKLHFTSELLGWDYRGWRMLKPEKF